MTNLNERIEREHAACRDDVKTAVHAINMSPCHTGGGCMAWEWASETRLYSVMITNEDLALDGDPLKEDWTVGLYNVDGAFVLLEDAFPLARAIELAEWLRNNLDHRSDLWEHTVRNTDLRYRIEK